MPQLSSGRHVGLAQSAMMDILRGDCSDDRAYYLIVWIRLHASGPAKLLQCAEVLYYDPPDLAPPQSTAFYSGFTVEDVKLGKAEWDQTEIAEFSYLLAHDERILAWAVEQHAELNKLIGNHSVWASPLCIDL